MESVSAPMVAATKLSVLNPGEFELWKMRIEQYFLMTDYALWKVILNGDSPLPTRTVDGVETAVPPKTTDQKLARKNELKARGTLLKALPNKHQLKFNTYKSAKSLMEAIEKSSDSTTQAHGSNSANIDSLSDAMVMLAMRARRFLNKTGRKVGSNGSKIIGYNKTKAKALVAQDGLGYDWSDQAEEGPTNFSLMAYTSSSSSSSNSEVSTCSNACLESVEARLDVYKKNEAVFEEDIKILKLDVMLRDNALTELRKKFEKAEKERDDLKLTLEKFKNSSKNLSKLLDSQISDKFKNSVGFNSQVFDSQVNDKYKTSEGYHDVPPPYTGNFMPPKPDLVLADEDDYIFIESVTSVPAVATSEVKTSESKPKSVSEPLIEDWISDSEDENETESKSKQRKPSFAKVEFVKSNEHVKSPRESVKMVENNKQAKYPRKNSQSPRGNKRNWNNLMTQKLGSNFEFKNKACYVCGSFNHLIKDCDFYEKKMVEKPVWNNARRVNHQNSQRMSHPNPKGNFDPRAVLMKSGLKTLNTARQNSSRAAVSVNTARPINTAYPRPTVNCARPASNIFNGAYSHVRRPFNKFTTNKNNNFNEKVNTVRGNVTTVRPKAVVNDNKENKANVVKASTCWVWRPKQKKLDHVSRHNEESTARFQEKGVIDSGLSRHMIGNKSYLSDYKEIDGGFIAFGGSTKGGKITGKGKIRTGKLDFKDVYFLKELKCDNETEFKNKEMNQFCEIKGIKREFSVARTLQQNGVAERKNKTLIEAARTMLADSKLPTTFWAEAVNIACYVQNMVLVIKPHNKTSYELFLGRKPALSFMRPFGCPVTILNTLDHLGKFDGKVDEGFFIGYSVNRSGPEWLFDIDTLTKSMNYKPIVTGNQSNGSAGIKACDNASKARLETVPGKDYILLPLWTQYPPLSYSLKDSPNVGFKPSGEEEKKDDEDPKNEDSKVRNTEEPRVNQEKDENVNSTNNINTVTSTVNTASIMDNAVDENIIYECSDDPNMPNLEEIVYSDDDEDVGAEADMTNLDTHISVSPIPTIRIHKDHLVEQIIRDIHSAHQTRRMTKSVTEHAQKGNPSIKISKLDRSYARRASAVQVTTEEGIDHDEVFAPVSRIEAIRLFLAYASFKDFVVYQMDVKSAFLYGKIEEEVYVCQPPGFEDLEFPDRDYKVEKALYGLHQAPRAWYETLSTYLLDNGFQRSQIDKTLFIKRVKEKPMEFSKPLMKDDNDEDVDVHLYRSMIGSLMYLTSSRPDIIFVVCACARFQVTSKVSHLHAMKRIFRYLKVANSTTEAEYVAASNCCGQLRIQCFTQRLCTVRLDITSSGIHMRRD
ncbi:putative ribonuclease H-like domain-containing protein [Tanacetum coccineum]